jgi:hypothetical protein
MQRATWRNTPHLADNIVATWRTTLQPHPQPSTALGVLAVGKRLSRAIGDVSTRRPLRPLSKSLIAQVGWRRSAAFRRRERLAAARVRRARPVGRVARGHRNGHPRRPLARCAPHGLAAADSERSRGRAAAVSECGSAAQCSAAQRSAVQCGTAVSFQCSCGRTVGARPGLRCRPLEGLRRCLCASKRPPALARTLWHPRAIDSR